VATYSERQRDLFLIRITRTANLFTVSHVTCIQNKTILKYAKSDANWLKRVNDVANQTQSAHFFGHPV